MEITETMMLSFAGHAAADEPSAREERPTRKRRQEPDESGADSSNRPQKKTKEARPKYQYGNYRTYYNYRIKKGQQDGRLETLSKEWFDGKKALDIGCNNGRITMQIAYRFDPEKIVGIDIDPELTKMATEKIERSKAKKQQRKEEHTPFPISFSLVHGALADKRFPDNVLFATGNYLETKGSEGQYDTILALSVTKWVHLNWGDEGMHTFFANVHRDLAPGGIFVLEPQEWRSYKKKGGLTPETKKHYQSIQFKPDQFLAYLTDKLHFKLLQTCQQPKEGSASEGFDRPVYILQKEGGKTSS